MAMDCLIFTPVWPGKNCSRVARTVWFAVVCDGCSVVVFNDRACGVFVHDVVLKMLL